MDVSTVKKPPIQPVTQAKRTEPAQHPHTQESRLKAPEVKKTGEARPYPVINTQGQVTGQRLNVTA